MLRPVALVLMAGWITLIPANAAIVFSDDFDTSLPASTPAADLPGWTEQFGTIDYLKAPTCLGGGGGCVDLVGISDDPADLLKDPFFTFLPGRTYTLTYWLAGNGISGSDTVQAFLGSEAQTITVPWDSPFTQHTLVYTATVATTLHPVVFHEFESGNPSDPPPFGAFLDSVTLEETVTIPEPATFALLASGLLTVMLRRKH